MVIATGAVCGFTHFAYMAMFVGGISALIPEKKRIIAAVGFRAMIVATLAYMMTACVAGVFFSNNSILLTK